ncbi:MAG: hypothetical protein J5J06_09625 [Phycisphaerae bacterium]|nr:hypothetical protein [Phycisphaerae bacterium]
MVEWCSVRKLRGFDRPTIDSVYEIQVLDEDGRAIGVGYLNDATIQLAIGDRQIPPQVISAARRCTLGDGQYVGPDGKVAPGF